MLAGRRWARTCIGRSGRRGLGPAMVAEGRRGPRPAMVAAVTFRPHEGGTRTDEADGDGRTVAVVQLSPVATMTSRPGAPRSAALCLKQRVRAGPLAPRPCGRFCARMDGMKVTDVEAAALKLKPAERADLAAKLLESLEVLSDEENEQQWAEEAARRDAELDADPSRARTADDVFRDAKARLG